MSSRRCGLVSEMLIREIEMADTVQPRPRPVKRSWVRGASVTVRNIDPVKVATIGMAILAAVSCMAAFVQHHNNQMAQLRMALRSSEYEWKRRTSELEGRYKRNAYKLDKLAAEQSHGIAKRAAGRVEAADEREPNPQNQTPGGTVYIRWGRRDCPQRSLSRMIYNGLGAGSLQGHTGGGAGYMCIHLNATYQANRYKDGFQGSSYLYGLEYRDPVWANDLFDLRDTLGGDIRYHTVPCAFCMTEGRQGKVMIPGKFQCPERWTYEYDGYIMAAGHSDKHSTEYICVDKRPQVVPGTQGSQSSSYLYLVETQCSGLHCEPLVAGREIPCVVCTI